MIPRLILVLLLLAGCGQRGNADDWTIRMDPRLADLAVWAYDCMLDVTGLADGNTLPPPNVQGVDAPWGNGIVGTYYHASRAVRVQITRPESHVKDILLHENGHDGDWRLNGKSDDEDYANWVNDQCRERNMPSIYPAPPIDWDAVE